ncbi:MAG TPA: hypothetical protein VFM09_14875 [Marmoricola sp.]|nr:hypothetical protein [Marmoricola sp.]
MTWFTRAQRLTRRLGGRARRGGGLARGPQSSGTVPPGVEVGALADLLPPGRRGQARRPQLRERLRACVHPDLYAAQLSPAERGALDELDVETALAHFLRSGARDGLRVCALFHPGWYEKQLTGRGLELPEGGVPFFHWLTVGWDERIVPTPLFDEDFYREQHPALDPPWLFGHYLHRGCYQPHWRPSPLGRHHPGGADAEAVARQRPLLLRELLHRAEDYDLSATSWLEEGCVAALAKLERLATPRARELVAKAAATEPLIHTPPARRRMLSCPPHRNQRVFLVELVESVRRAVGLTRVDSVVVAPGGRSPATEVAASFARSLASLTGSSAGSADGAAVATLLVTDGSGGAAPPGAAIEGSPGLRLLDLAELLEGVDEERSLAVLLDLVRGLGTRRLAVVGSDLGWRLLAAYGRQLSGQASLGAFLPDADLAAAGEAVGQGVDRFQGCFRHLDWVALESAATRDVLVERYLMPSSVRGRLLVAPTGEAMAAGVAAASRRGR